MCLIPRNISFSLGKTIHHLEIQIDTHARTLTFCETCHTYRKSASVCTFVISFQYFLGENFQCWKFTKVFFFFFKKLLYLSRSTLLVGSWFYILFIAIRTECFGENEKFPRNESRWELNSHNRTSSSENHQLNDFQRMCIGKTRSFSLFLSCEFFGHFL